MVYEALSSGVPTGLIDIQHTTPCDTPSAPHRIARAIEKLRESGSLIATDQWIDGSYQVTCVEPLREADRCAALVLQRWPDLH